MTPQVAAAVGGGLVEKDEVPAAMKGDGFEKVQRWIKTLVVGNAGVGKSWLLNVFKQDDIFKHAMSVGAVTGDPEYALFMDAGDKDQVGYVLCNVPGLLDSKGDPQKNAKAIEQAFSVAPDTETIVLFVMGLSPGGRLINQDLVTYNALLEYVPSLNSANTAVVINQFDEDAFETTLDMMTYRSDLQQQVRQLLVKDNQAWVTFLPKVSAKLRTKWQDDQMKVIKVLLDDTIRGLKPTKIQAAEGASLVMPEQRLKEQLESAEKTIADMKAEQERDPWKELDGVDVDADHNDEEWTKGHAFYDDMIDSMKSYAEKKGYKVFVIKKCGSKFDIWFKNTFDPETCSRKSRNDRRSYVYVK